MVPNYNSFPIGANMYQNVQDQYYQPTVTQPRYTPNTAWGGGYTTALPPYQQQNVGMQPNNSMIWVQGISAAKSYLVPNNSTVILWDSESPTVYIKSVDVNGKPSLTNIVQVLFRQ